MYLYMYLPIKDSRHIFQGVKRKKRKETHWNSFVQFKLTFKKKKEVKTITRQSHNTLLTKKKHTLEQYGNKIFMEEQLSNYIECQIIRLKCRGRHKLIKTGLFSIALQ